MPHHRRTPRPEAAHRVARRLAFFTLLILLAAPALLVLAAPALAAHPGDILWSMRFGGLNQDFFYDVARTHDGGVVAVGQSNLLPMGFGGDGLIVKYSASGAQEWSSSYDDGDGESDVFTDVAIDYGGRVFAVGYHATATEGENILAVMYNELGTVDWHTSIDGGADGNDKATDVVVSGLGDPRVVGTAATVSGDALWVGALSQASGAEVWAHTILGPSGSSASWGSSVALYKGSSTFVAGGVQNATGHSRVLVARLYSGGGSAWMHAYKPSGSLEARGQAVKLDPSGRAWVLATVDGAKNSDVLLLRYSIGGTRSLSRRYGFAGGRQEAPCDMALDGSGRVFVAGESDSAAGATFDGFVLSYTGAGALRYARLYPRSAARDTSFAAVLADGSGGAYVCGSANEPGGVLTRNRLVAHYGATGNRAWGKRIVNSSTPGEDEFSGLARCGSSGILAAGTYLYGAGDHDALAEKFQK